MSNTFSDTAFAEPGAWQDAPRGLADYLAVLQRRRRLVSAVFAGLLLLAVLVAWWLPAVYRSTATILIKEQEIPQELVRSTVTSFADERIQVITQQVMTRATLLEMVDKHSLYGSARQRETSEEILDRMRRDIRITPISAEVTDRRTGSPVKATIAFSLSYDSEVAANSQKIANELVTLFLNENVKNRQQKAAETTSFLDDELARIRASIAEIEQRLALFKGRNAGRLPDTTLANQMSSERALADLQRLDRDISFLEERRLALQTQLADTKPATPVLGGGGAAMEPDERLRALQLQLISLSGVFSEDHPDVRRLKREVAAFKQESGLQNELADREARLAELRNTLALLRQRYSDEHPDVVKLKRAYASIENAVRSGEGSVKLPAVQQPRKPDNPAYINLNTQVQTTVSQVAALRSERDTLKLRLDQIDLRMSQAPEVEREYLELTRDLDSNRVRFRELRDKQMQAQVAEQLERDRKAERFTLIEPPIFPEKPFRPNRWAILLVGLFLAVAGSLAATALRESLDDKLHGPSELLRLLHVPVLAVLPGAGAAGLLAAGAAGTAGPPSRWRQMGVWRWVVLAAVVLSLALVVLVLHWSVLPIDVAWYSLLRRLGW